MEQTKPTQLSARQQFESLSQAAERTGLSTRTLRRRIAAGDLRAYRSSPRIIRVDPRDVDDLLVPLRTVQTYPN
ncbi:MAG: helix-turn-helix domain-containing protein [Ornithinimicrobium sp.]